MSERLHLTKPKGVKMKKFVALLTLTLALTGCGNATKNYPMGAEGLTERGFERVLEQNPWWATAGEEWYTVWYGSCIFTVVERYSTTVSIIIDDTGGVTYFIDYPVAKTLQKEVERKYGASSDISMWMEETCRYNQ